MPKRSDIPPAALWLGLGGLIPFIAPVLVLFSGDPDLTPFALPMLFGYAVTILSFLGGIHWGRTLAGDGFAPDWPPLIWSVVPPLAAFGLLLAPGLAIKATGFAVAFVMAYFVDIKLVQAGVFPLWFKTLRKILTIGALASMIGVLVAGVAPIG